MEHAWILTYTGRKFFPFAPDVSEIDLKDIAHALSLKCRFTGHCHRFYSVAEHCIHASRLCLSEARVEALLHDAAEAYLPDVASGIKPHLGDFKALEKTVEHAIAARFCLSSQYGAHIKNIDRRLVVTEREQNLTKAPHVWETHVGVEPYYALELPFWGPVAAEQHFLARCKELGVK